MILRKEYTTYNTFFYISPHEYLTSLIAGAYEEFDSLSEELYAIQDIDGLVQMVPYGYLSKEESLSAWPRTLVSENL